jgi:hypothetical protein
MNQAARISMALGLLGMSLVGLNGDAYAQVATSTNGPVCSVEYVPQPPYSSTAPAVKIQVGTTTSCSSPKHIYTVCPSKNTGQSQCGGNYTTWAHYPDDMFIAVYKNALEAQTGGLWMETSGSCTSSGGNMHCFTSSPLRFKIP